MGIVEYSLLSLVALFFIVSILMPLAERLKTPYTVLLAGVGLVIGTIIVASENAPASVFLSAYDQWVVAKIGIDSEAILFIFLPVLLFDFALAVNVRRLLDDLAIIIIMAIVAVVVSAFLVGGALWMLAAASGAVCLLVGAVVSTTDPGAVVAIFRDLGAPRRLLVIVEGESLFNDAAAIVLFSLCLDAIVSGADFSFLGGAWSFVYGFAVGGIAGFCLGWSFSFLFRTLRGHVVAETTLTVALAYLAFLAGEVLLDASGVVAVVVAGLVTGSQGRVNMAVTSWPKVTAVWEQLGFWANSLIFLLASMLVPKVMVNFQWHEALLIVVAYLAAFAARAAMLYGLLPPLSLMGLSPAISNERKGLILWGGIRGAATLALALAVTEHPAIQPDDRQLVGAVASGFVLVTLLFNATTLGWMTRKLGLDRLSAADMALRNRVVAGALAEVRGHVHEVAESHDLSEPAVRDLEQYYDERIGALEQDAATLPRGAVEDRMALGLTMLGNLESRIYELRFTESMLGRTAVRGLRATAESLADAARTGGLEGYRQRMIEVLGFGYWMRLCLLLNRTLGIEGPLARAIASRFEELINNRIAIFGLVAFDRERLGNLVGTDVSDAADALLGQRLTAVTQALEALERQYPDYSNALQAGLLARAGLRWEAQRYRRLLDDSIIGFELYSSLARDLDHRRTELFRQTRLDLGMRSQELLAKVPLFRGLSERQRDEIAAMMATRFVVPGETIVHKGDVGTEMYFVGSGAAQVRLPDRDVVIANGDFFGELALLADKPVRTADVVALGFCRLLVLSRKDFMRLRAMRPEIDAYIRAAAGERLRENLTRPETSLAQ